MKGPFAVSAEWPKKFVPLPTHETTKDLLPGFSAHKPTSVAFSILQTGSDGRDKVRRGEDWRRGHQNMTVSARDASQNHRTINFLGVARAFAHAKVECLLWGTDQQDAYRNLQVKEPQDTYTILQTPNGPTLWLQRIDVRINRVSLGLWPGQ